MAVGALFGYLSGMGLQRANARAIQRRYEFTRPALGRGLAVGRGAYWPQRWWLSHGGKKPQCPTAAWRTHNSGGLPEGPERQHLS